MKLHILLDYHLTPSELVNGDLYLVSAYNKTDFPSDVSVVCLNNSRANSDLDVYYEINTLLSEFDIKYKPCWNTISLAFLYPYYNILLIVKDILRENEIDSIVLYGGSEYPFFTSEGAEGEGYRKNYQTNWMVNGLLYNHFKGEVPTSWKHKRSGIYFLLHNKLRRAKNYSKLVINEIINSISNRNVKCDYSLLRKVDTIVIVELPLQLRHIKEISSYLSSKMTICTINKTLVGDSESNILFIKPLRVFKIFQIAFTSISLKRKDVYWQGCLTNQLFKEISYLYLKYRLKEQSIMYPFLWTGVSLS